MRGLSDGNSPTWMQNPLDIIASADETDLSWITDPSIKAIQYSNRLVSYLECVHDRRSSSVSAFSILGASSSIFRYISSLSSILSPQSLPARRNQFIALFYIAQSTIGSFAMYAQNIIYFAKRMPLENWYWLIKVKRYAMYWAIWTQFTRLNCNWNILSARS